jgi:voltage-gated potassium channel
MLPANMKLTLAMVTVLTMLASGTIIYHFLEGWNWVDSFYFTGVTLTTVGYGDFHPTHDSSKIFTVFLAFSGITVVFYSVSVVASIYFHRQQEVVERRLSVIERMSAKEKQKNSIMEKLEARRGP